MRNEQRYQHQRNIMFRNQEYIQRQLIKHEIQQVEQNL